MTVEDMEDEVELEEESEVDEEVEEEEVVVVVLLVVLLVCVSSASLHFEQSCSSSHLSPDSVNPRYLLKAFAATSPWK